MEKLSQKRPWETLAVELGKVEDKHLLRLSGNPNGLFQMRPVASPRSKKVSGYRITLPPHARWPACKLTGQPATFEIVRDALLVTLPAWAWDEKAKSEAERRAAHK